jgi:colanic acid biosynthesis glycosyl transferase WcaI
LRILIISQYFWPENFIISDVAAELASNGNQITVLTSKPNYPGGDLYEDYKKASNRFNIYKNVKIIRVLTVPRRTNNLSIALNYAGFAINSILYCLFKFKKNDFDLVFAFQPSPVFSVLPAVALKFLKKMPYVIWVQDLWPETISAIGFKNKVLLYKIVSFLSHFIYSNADALFVQSKGFKAALELRNLGKDKIYYIPNYNQVEFLKSMKEKAIEFNKEVHSFNILFAGNLGSAQDIESVFKAILLLKNNPNIKWHFVGSGRMLAWLRNKIQIENLQGIVFTYGNFPINRMHSFVNPSDCLLISLKDCDLFSITIPAKLQFYLSSGKPILGMINGEAADIIKKSKAGLVCQAGNYRDLVTNINTLQSYTKKELFKIGQKGVLYCDQFYNKQKIIQDMQSLFKRILIPYHKNYFYNKSHKPKFLVLLAVFNGAKYLSDQIQSILNQADIEVEILINIDKSSDGSEKLCRDLSKVDNRIKILKYGRVYGSASLNFFELLLNIKKFKFDYVSLSDQDDIWDNDKLIRAHNLLVSNNANGYSSDVFAFWSPNKKIYLKKSYPFKKYDFLFESAGPGCTYVLDKKLTYAFHHFISGSKKELINKVNYHDWLIYAFSRKNNFKWIIDSRTSMLYRQHNSNVIGARIGIKAHFRRVKNILSGAGFAQHALIANLIGIKDMRLLMNTKRSLLLATFTSYKFRRYFIDQLLFSFVCLIFIFKIHSHKTTH